MRKFFHKRKELAISEALRNGDVYFQYRVSQLAYNGAVMNYAVVEAVSPIAAVDKFLSWGRKYVSGHQEWPFIEQAIINASTSGGEQIPFITMDMVSGSLKFFTVTIGVY